MQENLVIADAISTMEDFVAIHGEYSTKEAWQTLKNAVLAQQTNNNARDEICPDCNGSGQDIVNSMMLSPDCSECGGTGKLSPIE